MTIIDREQAQEAREFQESLKAQADRIHIGHTVPGSFCGYCPACQSELQKSR